MSTPIDNNNDHDKNTSTSAILLDEAMDLCRQEYENPCDELLIEHIHQWQKKSKDHLVSWRQAEVLWQASAKIRPQFIETGLFNKLLLSLQIRTEIIRDAISKKIKISKTWMMIGAPVLSTSLLLCTVFLNKFSVTPPNSIVQPTVSIGIQYQTEWKQQREINLDDGSVVYLNWDTQISVTINERKRHIILHRGEAQFSVASDKTRPFIVETQGVSVTAVGTSFVVQYIENKQTRITVSEGIVEVNSLATEPIQLTFNQQVTSTPAGLSEVIIVDTNKQYAWQHGMLVFRDRPLLEVLAELDRYTSFIIEAGFIFDTDRRVTGTYFTDRADDALTLIALAFDLELEILNENNIMINSKKPNRPN